MDLPFLLQSVEASRPLDNLASFPASTGRLRIIASLMADGTVAADIFRVWPFRFHFTAQESIAFSAGTASNVLRGAFGSIFRRLACAPDCTSAKSCEFASQCPYALAFEPRQQWAAVKGPSGFADWPRPFVFRALHLDNCRILPDRHFYFDLILFEPPAKLLAHCIRVFRELAEEGLGPTRGRATLSKVEDLSINVALDDRNRTPSGNLPGLQFRFDNSIRCVSQLTVNFLTPTELKSEGELVTVPEFSVLLARLRDRISNLRSLYQGGPLHVDFESLGRAAQQIRTVNKALRYVRAERRSSRTGQRHSIGGFTGHVLYEGDLSPFLPFLQVGHWTGVGRQTVWGKGMLQCSAIGTIGTGTVLDPSEGADRKPCP